MNLYKFNFDLAGSSNAVQTITIPTDSKYSMGLKFFKGSEELVIGDDVKITIQDDKYIYTPTEIFNNYAVFAGATGSNAGESKTYQVNFHKDGSEPEVINEYDYVNTGSSQKRAYITIACNDFLAAVGDDVEKWDLHNFKFYFDGMAVAKNGLRMSDDYGTAPYISHAYSEKYGFVGGFNVCSKPGTYIIIPSKSGNKIGWRIYNKAVEETSEKYGKPIDEADIITTGKFSDYGVDLVGKVFMVGSGSSVNIPANTTWHQKVEMGEAIPAVDANFKGVNVKTNNSNISNWAITDSQMKVVYTDEWETMKDNADDRVIYFVVDRPTPPKPVPPKPTPGGDGKYFNLYMTTKNDDPDFDDLTEDSEYNPNDYWSKYAGMEQGVKATYRGMTVYLDQVYNSSSQAEEVEVEGNPFVKIDQISVDVDRYSWDGENKIIIYANMIENGKLYSIEMHKNLNSEEEVEEYYNNYMSVFGEDGDTPGDAGIPADLDEFEIDEESKFAFEDVLDNIISKVDTDKYYWLYGSGEVEPEVTSEMKVKMWKVDTYPQWQPAGPQ